jgi:uncharacterized protein
MSRIAHYIYRIQPTRPAMLTEGPTAAEADCIERHFAYMQELADQGTLLLAGRTLNNDSSAFGIAIFRAESPAAARELMEHDPAIREGVMSVGLFPYRIALFNPEAASLE